MKGSSSCNGVASPYHQLGRSVMPKTGLPGATFLLPCRVERP
jgi:hypothetical protein